MCGLFDIEWVAKPARRLPPPDPAHPIGVDLDASDGAEMTCSTPLVYPAPGRGEFIVECRICFMRVSVTAFGRMDDPRTLILPCQVFRA